AALRQKELLLVLDNCEHLIDEAARLADALLGGCPRLRILATSREPLGVAGEVEWVVRPLATPGEGNPADAESVRLFGDRARRRQPGFELTEENSRAVGDICRRLDGVPLAVELAAARVAVLAPEQISARLDNALSFLTEGNRTAAPRHRTLQATLAWSYDLLDERERLLFERLSVFAGGFSLEAAEAVGADGGSEGILDLLSKLVHKSLVMAEATEGGALRYGLLEPVRQYAWERLAESGGVEGTHRRHAAFFLDLAEEARPGINGVEREAWRSRLEAERGNLRTALRWSLENGEVSTAMRIANAIFWFWFHRGHGKEGRGWLEEALAMGGAEPERAEVLGEVGMFAWLQGDHEVSRSRLEESVEICRKTGHSRGLIHPLHFLSMEMLGRGETEKARSLAEESVEISHEEGDGFDLAIVLANLGLAAHTQKDDGVARPALVECIKVCRRIGDDWLLSLPFRHLGYMELREGNHEKATELFEEGLGALRNVREKWFVARAVETLAIASAMRGSPVKAARLFG
ncbi:MAG: ATP-binding protein, partial [Rubrobacteraceae bacterium]